MKKGVTKRLGKPVCDNRDEIADQMLGFKHFKSACSTIQGIETMNMIRKGQANTKTVFEEITLINLIFNVA